MRCVLPDINCQGHFQVLQRLLADEARGELWHFLHLEVLTFDDLGLLTAKLMPVQAASLNLCTLFTTKEVKTLLGTGVGAGEPAAMGTGCQWFGKDEQSYAIVQMVGSDYCVDSQQAPGYEPIPNLGKRAYSHSDMEGGWRAMALTDHAAASVVLIGKTATRASVVTLIRQLLERQQKGK